MPFQEAVIFDIEGHQCPLSKDEARTVVEELRRLPETATPDLADGALGAAVHVERLLEEGLGTTNPPMTELELWGLMTALTTLSIDTGITNRQAHLLSALQRYLIAD